MENNNSSKGVITLLIVIIVILGTLCALFATDTISFSSNLDNNKQTNGTNAVDNNQEKTNEQNYNNVTDCDNLNEDFVINKDELNKIMKSDYNFLKQESMGDYSFNLSVDGKININFENEITNIDDAIDIVIFDEACYILTKKGDIYKYDSSNYKSNDYNAVKITEYNNISKMITYNTRKANAGGCNYIVLIDNNNKYYVLDSACV